MNSTQEKSTSILCKQCNTQINMNFVDIHRRRCIAIKKTDEKKKQSQQHGDRESRAEKKDEDVFICYLCGEEQPVNGLDAHIQNCKNKQIECDRCGQSLAGDKFQKHRLYCEGPPQEPVYAERPNERKERAAMEEANVPRERLLPLPEPKNYEQCQAMLSAMARKNYQLINLGLRAYYHEKHEQFLTRIRNEWDLIQTAIRTAATEADTPKQGGLTTDQIDSIPEKRYRYDGRHKDNCKICFTDICDEEAIRVLDCRHWFHGICLYQWLLMNKSCPTCRKIIVPSRKVIPSFPPRNSGNWANNKKM